MTHSMNLITAQISFLEPRLAIIHIPLDLYPFFLQPILRLLFGEDHDEDAVKIAWTNRHDFLNFSITPIECSVICSRELADRYFAPLVTLFDQLLTSNPSQTNRRVEIARDDYIVIQVDGQGLDAGQRVLELTSPLAMAGISIFFITTYFSDYILVPHRARRTVTKALEQRGFVFSQSADAFVSQLSPSSPTISHQMRCSPGSFEAPPSSTPPAKDIPELQSRTFTKLKQKNISPATDRSLRLIGCAGSRENSPTNDSQLRDDLLQVLLATCPSSSTSSSTKTAGLGLKLPVAAIGAPDFSTRFLSLTLTSNEPISVLLEASLAEHLTKSLMGGQEESDILIPIVLDLRDLPMHATGIVCGVAGRLAQGTSLHHSPASLVEETEHLQISPQTSVANGHQEQAIEISFLSTARAGAVILKADELDRAIRALEEVVAVVQTG